MPYVSFMMPSDLEAMGKSIYGYGWQTKLARDLDVNIRTVQRWIAGSSKVKKRHEDWIRKRAARKA